VRDRVLLGGWLLLAVAGSAAQTLEPPIDAEGRLSARWRVAGLPQQKPALTQFISELVDGRPALRLEARASYGNLVLDAATGAAVPRRLSWAWRIELPNTVADLRTKAGDDTAARVCLAFDLPLDRVPFLERQMLRMARAQTGQPLPAATLCWVWGAAEPQQALIDNAYSRRVRYLVLRNQGDGSGRWHQESVDVAADFRRAFGDESSTLPPLVAVIVAADADNTRAQSVAHLRALSFEP
jgi:hypothetical protein